MTSEERKYPPRKHTIKKDSFKKLRTEVVSALADNTLFFGCHFEECEFKNLDCSSFYSCTFWECRFTGEIKDCEFNASTFSICSYNAVFENCNLVNVEGFEGRVK